MRDGIPIASNGTPSIVNGESDINGFPMDRFSRQYADLIIDGNQFENVDEYEEYYFKFYFVISVLFSADGHMQTSTHSALPDGSDKFFTIDESYCPTTQNHPLLFDNVVKTTILHYIENVSYHW